MSDEDEMVAAVEAHLATMDWNADIDAAPKMVQLLLYAATDINEAGAVLNWKMGSGCFLTGYDAWEWEGRVLKSYDIQPTHWRHLPKPPHPQSNRGKP